MADWKGKKGKVGKELGEKWRDKVCTAQEASQALRGAYASCRSTVQNICGPRAARIALIIWCLPDKPPQRRSRRGGVRKLNLSRSSQEKEHVVGGGKR